MADEVFYVLGINAYDHDVSACLLADGAVVAAVSKERITRIKHDAGFYAEAMDYCLEFAGIPLDRVDRIVRNSYVLPVPEIEERLRHHHRAYHLTPRERERALSHPLFGSDDARLAVCSHHLAHAYSAFAFSPFDAGAVMIVDGVGSYREDALEALPEGDAAPPLARESESYYRFDGSELEALEKVWLEPARGLLSDEFYSMEGLGALYSRVSDYIFGDWNKCGEVMGLAPYGRLRGEPLMKLRDDGRIEVRPWGEEFRHPFLGGSDAEWEASPHRAEWQDLARRVQEDAETILLERARRLHEKTGAKNLCIAGGVALNCVANGRIQRESPFENVWIQPAAGDDGIALGCAAYGHVALGGRPRGPAMTHAYLGRTYDRFDREEAERPWSVRFFVRRRRVEDVAEATAELLAAGNVLGWFQGRSEFGPRALGNRSILADPRDPAMKDRVNAQVKKRQGFRPFAPVVPFERAADYFEGGAESPFMLLAQAVREEARDQIPAIVHVDGTARVQTVRRESNPLLHALLLAFERRTGVAVLLNTSFNLRGDPIVEMPMEAMDSFLMTGFDALVIDDRVYRKRRLYRWLRPFIRTAASVRSELKTDALMERYARKVLEA